jgi:hypothetical protein
VSAYEGLITMLEREKILLGEKAERIVPPKGRFEEFIELSHTTRLLSFSGWKPMDRGRRLGCF